MGRLATTPSLPVGVLRPRRKLLGELDEDWQLQAACRGKNPDLWHPEQGDQATAEQARRVCAGCPVRVECLAHAIVANEPLAIWGGCTERQRRVVRRGLGKRQTDPIRWLARLVSRLEKLDRDDGSHGTSLMYARGCHCPACSLAASLDRSESKLRRSA